MEWHYNTPYESHRVRIWERLFRSVRRILGALSCGRTMSYEILNTYFAELEIMLNDRSLVSVNDDPEQLETLSPINLLLFRKPNIRYIETNLRKRHFRQW
ncbi:unnamed protein product [Schistosoma margrebowiei]|uniref:Uncharacterized protein n=1 Tax=Schistosoma margrebowiei TaxID=48269 RepID=A0A183LG45_9TREM|nr:unnamed protein product [Schistosoma margrebowiei]